MHTADCRLGTLHKMHTASTVFSSKHCRLCVEKAHCKLCLLHTVCRRLYAGYCKPTTSSHCVWGQTHALAGRAGTRWDGSESGPGWLGAAERADWKGRQKATLPVEQAAGGDTPEQQKNRADLPLAIAGRRSATHTHCQMKLGPVEPCPPGWPLLRIEPNANGPLVGRRRPTLSPGQKCGRARQTAFAQQFAGFPPILGGPLGLGLMSASMRHIWRPHLAADSLRAAQSVQLRAAVNC